ncbi:hypothetical protein ACA910_001293 [Epithemia clementina (nom. ined.)]
MQDLERDSDSDEEIITSPTSPVTYRPSPYELLCNAKIEINRKYLESIGLEKAASELKKQASPSQKENKTAGKKSSLGNVEDAEVTPTSKTWPKQKCASTETAVVKKKRMMAKQRHERKKLQARRATVLLQTGLRFWTIGKVIHKTITSFELLIVYRFSLMASHGSLALSARSCINLG